MNLSVLIAAVWLAAVAGARRWRPALGWPGAAALTLTGIPLLGWVTYQNGPLVGMLALGGGVLMLLRTSVYGAEAK